MMLLINNGTKKYFCISTYKATNPLNIMGDRKRIIEMFINRKSKNIKVSISIFANLAFSDGSLFHRFNQQIKKTTNGNYK
jgi:FlaA1/EpsC-like NDP-sugar epimerase